MHHVVDSLSKAFFRLKLTVGPKLKSSGAETSQALVKISKKCNSSTRRKIAEIMREYLTDRRPYVRATAERTLENLSSDALQ